MPFDFRNARTARLLGWLCDAVLTIAFAALGAALAGWSVSTTQFADFYGTFMPEVVYFACGKGWVHPVQTPQVLLDFFAHKTLSFDCGLLPPILDVAPPSAFSEAHAYLAKAIGETWRATSISYENLWPVAALLGGAYTSGLYLLIRLFFGKTLSSVGAAILALSPMWLGFVFYLRDFSKAPFFVWSLLLVLAAARSRSIARSLALGGAAGVVIGIGYGWRSDLAIMWPFGLIPLLLVRPFAEWRFRCASILAFFVGTFIAIYPLPVAKISGGFGSPLMQGMTDPFQNYLGMGPAPYSFGSRYSDEWTMSTIAADMSGGNPDWEDRNAVPGETISTAVTKSGPYVMRWLPIFAGDMATQTIKSALWVLGMPTLLAPARRSADWKASGPTSSIFGPDGFAFYDVIAQPWLPWLSLGGLLLLVLQSHAARPDETIALVVLFAALLGYVALQFAPRHIFHLEFIWVLALLAIARAPFQLGPMRRAAPVVGSFAFVVAMLIIGTRSALTFYQDNSLQSHIQALLDRPRTDVAQDRVDDGGSVAFRIPVPPKFERIVSGPPDSMTSTIGQRGLQWYIAAGGERLLISVGGAACPAKPFKLFFRYTKRPGSWQNLDYSANLEGGASLTQIIVPALYRATQNFGAIELPKEAAGCIQKIEWINGTSPLPLGLTFVLPADWRQKPLHRGLGGFPTSQFQQPPLFPLYNTVENVN